MNGKIVIDPNICHGKPVFRNTRILVSNILADLAAGRTAAQIQTDYPAIDQAAIREALEFGSKLANFDFIPTGA